jgi:hypothetical protein
MARKQQNDNWCEVLAYDPGGTTGWAVACITPKDLLSDKVINHRLLKHFAHGQIVGDEMTQIDQLVELVDIWPKAAVVGESFVQRIRNTGLETDEAYSPVRINATLRWWLATEDRHQFKQTPSQAKDRWTDDRLDEVKLNPEGGHATRHARDGVRHAMLFMGRARQTKRLRHVAWPQFFNEKGELL